MKRLTFLLFFILTLCFKLSAQDLLVYYVVGNVTYTQNGTAAPLAMNTRIAPTTVINIPDDSRVELLDVKNAKRIIIITSGKGAVNTFTKNRANTSTSVSQQYVQYVLKQMDNDQLTALKQHSRDSEQTADLLKSIEDSEGEGNGFADIFNEFREDIHKEFEEFRRKNNEEYAEFVRKIWKQFKAAPVMPKPQDDFIKPVVYNDPIGEPTTDRWRFIERVERLAKAIFKPNKDEVEKMKGNKRPKPATPDNDSLCESW